MGVSHPSNSNEGMLEASACNMLRYMPPHATLKLGSTVGDMMRRAGFTSRDRLDSGTDAFSGPQCVPYMCNLTDALVGSKLLHKKSMRFNSTKYTFICNICFHKYFVLQLSLNS